MDLLDRYLQAVRFFLPTDQQDDIVRELSENLVSEMEDQQEARGRPLTEDEQADILRRHGHPMLVAGRYRTRQQLIGPALFPMYVFALKIGLGVALLATLLLALTAAIVTGDPMRHFGHALGAFPGRGLMVFAWTTLGFAAVDFAQLHMKLGHAWDPRTLPRLVRRDRWTSRASSLFEVLVYGACLVWLLLLPGEPRLLLGQAATIIQIAPVWHLVYVPLVLLTAASVVLSAVDVVRPYWTPARSFARMAMQIGGIVTIGLLLRAGPWVILLPGARATGGASLERVTDVVNRSCEIGLYITGAICLFEIGREIYRLRHRQRDSLALDPAPPPATGTRAR